MKKGVWIANRLKAMSGTEVIWRVQQKALQKHEKYTIFTARKPVTEICLNEELQQLIPDIDRLGINWDNSHYTLFENLNLFGCFEYKKYKNYSLDCFLNIWT